MAHEARTSNEPPPPRGILRATPADGLFVRRRMLPSAKLAAHVHHFWSVRWALRSPFTAETLPRPSAQIIDFATAGERRTQLLGVHTGRLARCLADKGEIFGITFRPAMFQPLLRASMASLTDRVVSLDRALGSKARAWTRALDEGGDVDDKVAITEAFLVALLPPLCPRLARWRELVELMAVDRSILRVEDLAELSGLDTRALQRGFQTYVGVSPKWVIQRYRLHEAAMQLAGPHPPALAALAASLGYADQAHFGRDFKRTVGQTPRSFERERAKSVLVYPA
jgi:AraC-like DNA-binding protein